MREDRVGMATPRTCRVCVCRGVLKAEVEELMKRCRVCAVVARKGNVRGRCDDDDGVATRSLSNHLVP
jgi:hypothetical protein